MPSKQGVTEEPLLKMLDFETDPVIWVLIFIDCLKKFHSAETTNKCCKKLERKIRSESAVTAAQIIQDIIGDDSEKMIYGGIEKMNLPTNYKKEIEKKRKLSSEEDSTPPQIHKSIPDGFREELPPQILEDPFKHSPLLQYYSQDRDLITASPFREKKVIFVLHFLRDLIPFVKAAINLGLEMKDACFFYKDYPYPQREAIAEWLKKEGAVVKSRTSISGYLEQLSNQHPKLFKQILIIEDGGFFVSKIHSDFGQLIPYVKGAVEQTTRGIRNTEEWEKKSNENKLRFPVFSVAKSKLKGDYEPPYVSQAVIDNLKQLLPSIPLRGKSFAVLGGGTIGREIAILLKNNGSNVTIYDKNKDNILWAKEHGFSTADSGSEAVHDKNFVIGASGEQSINPEVIAALSHGTYVVSVSSELYEIDIDELTKMTSSENRKELINRNGKYIGTKFVLPPTDRVINVLANGYPINFWGFESMPDEASDLILLLILLSSVEVALGTHSPGISADMVNKIAEKYEVSKKLLEIHKQG